ncbi:Hsp70 family protein [Desulfococcus sp.]|uniref:Hsp70 family protein n=1 Tax=Desulfococcus sp. TaxID=2025834 RepID=UPI0035937FAF
MEPIVGIDLGTTNSEIAYIINDRAEVLKDGDDGILPSCVGLTEDGKIIVGAEAKNQAVIAPDRTVLSVKRLMGRDEKIAMGDGVYRPQEISAFILKALKSRAEKVLGRTVSKAVITVPAYFTDAQRHATREAGEIAGLEVIRIINEPTAAALAYESNQSETRRVLVFDLGGGTFDVSIVKIEAGIVEVLSSTGDNHLGGDDFDQKIVELLLEECESALDIDVTHDRAAMARLRRAAEAAKILLSSEPFAMIEEDHIGTKDGRPAHLSYELSRDQFQELIDDDLSRTMESVSQALRDADLLASHIDKIILVGGSTRIPAVSGMLATKFGRIPHSGIDPDLCVAVGAAIQAGREMGLKNTGILLDITPYTFGTSAIGEVDGIPTLDMFVPIIRRNTKLPTARTEAFSTVQDNQKAAEIKVYQGEKPHALDNIRIGTYMFDLTRAPAGSVILLNYSLDLNGILKLEAVEKHTGRKIQAVIENAFSQYSEETLSESRNRLAEMWDDPDGPALAETEKPADRNTDPGLPEALSVLLKRAEAKLPAAHEEDREEIAKLMKELRARAAEADTDAVKALADELEDLLFYVE